MLLLMNMSLEAQIPNLWAKINNNSNDHIPRHENTFVQAGNRFYLFGGRESPQTVEIYNYETNTWSTGASAPKPFNHFQAIEYQGYIWVIGAFKTNSFPNEPPEENIHLYDPVANVWLEGREVPATRQRGSTGLVTYEDKFYVACGNTVGHAGGYVSWFDAYDPCSNEWTELTDAPRPRDHFFATTANGKLYLVSGRQSGGPGGVFAPMHEEVDIFDFQSNTWSTLPSSKDLPTPRAAGGVVTFQNKIFVIGGEGNGQAYNTVEAFNLSSQNWETLASMNHARHGTQAIATGDGIYITSGSPNQGGGKQTNMEYYGNDNPQGTPITASTLNTPETVSVAVGGTQTVSISASGGNQGLFIRSVSIVGTDANEFSFVETPPELFLIKANDSYAVELQYNGTGDFSNTFLEIEYGANQIKSVPLVEMAAGSSLDLSFSLQSRTDASGNYTFEFYDLAGNSLQFSQMASANADGEVVLGNIALGNYRLYVKPDKYLAIAKNISISTGLNTLDLGEFNGGDADGNNRVEAIDFSLLASVFNTATSIADFNGDGIVSALDFSILASNFNTAGDDPTTN